MKRKWIYFAHPIKTYNTKDEKAILNQIRLSYPDYEVINPADFGVVDFRGCKNCMKEHMIPQHFKLIKHCTIIIVWGERDSCGIHCEVCKAWELGKEIVSASIKIELKPITLQEYHYKDSK